MKTCLGDPLDDQSTGVPAIQRLHSSERWFQFQTVIPANERFGWWAISVIQIVVGVGLSYAVIQLCIFIGGITYLFTDASRFSGPDARELFLLAGATAITSTCLVVVPALLSFVRLGGNRPLLAAWSLVLLAVVAFCFVSFFSVLLVAFSFPGTGRTVHVSEGLSPFVLLVVGTGFYAVAAYIGLVFVRLSGRWARKIRPRHTLFLAIPTMVAAPVIAVISVAMRLG